MSVCFWRDVSIDDNSLCNDQTYSSSKYFASKFRNLLYYRVAPHHVWRIGNTKLLLTTTLLQPKGVVRAHKENNIASEKRKIRKNLLVPTRLTSAVGERQSQGLWLKGREPYEQRTVLNKQHQNNYSSILSFINKTSSNFL